MGIYKYIQQAWKNPKRTIPELMRERLISWRREPACVRIERPTRLDKARALGYKPKQGVVLVRQRVPRGSHKREKIRKGRRPKAYGSIKNLSINYQVIAEQRANRKYPNTEVLNSYLVGQDGKNSWFEIILVDPFHPSILADSSLRVLIGRSQRGRVFRGKTSAARRSRGLLNKGKGAEKLRPSRRAVSKRKINAKRNTQGKKLPVN